MNLQSHKTYRNIKEKQTFHIQLNPLQSIRVLLSYQIKEVNGFPRRDGHGNRGNVKYCADDDVDDDDADDDDGPSDAGSSYPRELTAGTQVLSQHISMRPPTAIRNCYILGVT